METLKSQATATDNPTGLITNNIDIWTSAIQTRSASGRSSRKKLDLYGIKKLRELILELAVTGKLVPQNQTDEPGSSIVEQSLQRKEQISKERKLQLSKDRFKCTPCFDAPDNWHWVCIGDICHVLGGKRVPRGYKLLDTPTDHAYIRVTDMKNQTVLTDDLKYIDENVFSQISKYTINSDDVYVTIAGTIGAAGTIPKQLDGMNLTENASKLVFGYLDKQFLVQAMSSGYIQNQFSQAVNQMAQPKLSLSSIKQTAIAIPPLTEQHRIVAKVDELMALCDQLEQQTEARIDAHATLVETLLTTLTNSADAAELEHNWNRLADNFDTLFTTEHSIDQLKQTVLQLAVMGKLVPQDPNDEPAAVLLEKIAAEKARLVKEKKIKQQKPLPPIGEDEKPFAVPERWEWCRIGDAMLLKNGYAFKSKHFVSEPTQFVLTTPGNFFEAGGFRARGDKTRFYDGDVESDFIFQAGDLMIPMTEQAPGLLGSSAFIPDDGKTYIHNQRLGKLTPYCSNSTSLEFIALFFNSPYLRGELAESCTGTTVRHTSPDRIYNVLFPVFPLAEQQRIVAKVDQLMTLFDQLKTRLQLAQQTQLHLADALVEQAVG